MGYHSGSQNRIGEDGQTRRSVLDALLVAQAFSGVWSYVEGAYTSVVVCWGGCTTVTQPRWLKGETRKA